MRKRTNRLRGRIGLASVKIMGRITIIGCGIIGAMIAYELSKHPDLHITVLDKQLPARESTGAALGVLMGIISQKKKGRAWTLRDRSIRRYESLVPELEHKTGRSLPFNRDGIVLLQFEGDSIDRWSSLIELRRLQGWTLEYWDAATLHEHCPHVGEYLGDRPIIGAVYSPQDRQVDPTALTLALVEAARLNGVSLDWNAKVTVIQQVDTVSPIHYRVQTSTRQIVADQVVITAGLGSMALVQALSPSHPKLAPNPIDLRPVLGQAVRVNVSEPMGQSDFRPVISGDDIHIVPLAENEYWIGATVEFPDEASQVIADEDQLEQVLEGAIALCPSLSRASVLQQWFGHRPRPWNRPAPIIEPLVNHPSVWLATGHYRNGVLLAPATAEVVCAELG